MEDSGEYHDPFLLIQSGGIIRRYWCLCVGRTRVVLFELHVKELKPLRLACLAVLGPVWLWLAGQVRAEAAWKSKEALGNVPLDAITGALTEYHECGDSAKRAIEVKGGRVVVRHVPFKGRISVGSMFREFVPEVDQLYLALDRLRESEQKAGIILHRFVRIRPLALAFLVLALIPGFNLIGAPALMTMGFLMRRPREERERLTRFHRMHSPVKYLLIAVGAVSFLLMLLFL